jgi:hypothetical protein
VAAAPLLIVAHSTPGLAIHIRHWLPAQAGDFTAFPASIGIFYSTRIGEKQKVQGKARQGKAQGTRHKHKHEHKFTSSSVDADMNKKLHLSEKLLLIILGLSQVCPLSHLTPH